VVIASTFSQNTFGYDGHGFAVFLAAPLPLREVLLAKNLVQGAAGLALAVAVSVFYRVYFGAGTVWAWGCAVAGALTLLPVLLSAGNLLSLYFPVKFHASLKRRDKVPFAASLLGIAAASLGAAPLVHAIRSAGPAGPGPQSVAMLLLCAVAAWLGYRALWPLTFRLLDRRREAVLRAVTRD
jgi:ABC-2 type transport system permease protein